MHVDRTTALQKLIAYQLPIEPVLATLASFGWDAVTPLVTLSTGEVVQVIERFLSGKITSEQLTDWADLIECREDIEVSKESPNLAEVIFRLANPNLREPITPVLVAEIRNTLLTERNAG